MLKVGLLTSWNERCGIAEYAKNLVFNTSRENTYSDVEQVVLNINTFNSENTLLFRPEDIIHINYEPGLFGWLTTSCINHLKAMGKKTVLTLHTSHDGDNRSEFTNAFDRVVV